MEEKIDFFDIFARDIILKHNKIMEIIKNNGMTGNFFEGNIFINNVIFNDNKVFYYTFPTTYPRSANVIVDNNGNICNIDFNYHGGMTYSDKEAEYTVMNNEIIERKLDE